ncbi:MAG: formate dehydrogenase accessory sulfurtransferase FdhD, partial [Pseudobdellovibrionaceae bacterium]|nr:formate dehydrogenase accessory sulfurtransferase FdhD [Pseudobdellovibrionaceae bacterium]
MKIGFTQEIKTWDRGQVQVRTDRLAEEAPMEFIIDHCDGQHWHRQNIAVTMRTPGEDSALALGFLFTESVIQSHADVDRVEERLDTSRPRVIVRLKDGVRVDLQKLTRHVFTNSSCGVCSQASLDQVQKLCPIKPEMSVTVDPDQLLGLPRTMRDAQKEFGQTGGLHASGLFQTDGRLLLLSEDVGRHNALDKLIGKAMRQGLLPLRDTILLLSGRASFELIQKAALAGIPFVAALGAPSSLASTLADTMGMTLVGFLRE